LKKLLRVVGFLGKNRGVYRPLVFLKFRVFKFLVFLLDVFFEGKSRGIRVFCAVPAPLYAVLKSFALFIYGVFLDVFLRVNPGG
jgi:hypothetical protein